jgi:hypothetical protein
MFTDMVKCGIIVVVIFFKRGIFMGRKVTSKNSDGNISEFNAVRKNPKEFEKLERREVKEILGEYEESRFISPEINIDKIYDVIWQKNELDEVGTILGYLIVNTPSKEDSAEKDYIFGYSKAGLRDLKKMGYETVRLAQFPASHEVSVSSTMFNNFADKVLPNRDKVEFFEEEKDVIGKRIDTFSKSATDDYYLITKGLYIDRLKDQQTAVNKGLSNLAKEVLKNKSIVHNILNFNASFEEGLSAQEKWMLLAFLKLKKDYINGDHVAGKAIEEALKVIRQYKATETAKMRDSMIPTKTDIEKDEHVSERDLDKLGEVVLNDQMISTYIESHFSEDIDTMPMDWLYTDNKGKQIVVEVKTEGKDKGVQIPLPKKQHTDVKLNDRELFMLKIYLLSQNECGVNTIYFNSNLAEMRKKFEKYEKSEDAVKRVTEYYKSKSKNEKDR